MLKVQNYTKPFIIYHSLRKKIFLQIAFNLKKSKNKLKDLNWK